MRRMGRSRPAPSERLLMAVLGCQLAALTWHSVSATEGPHTAPDSMHGSTLTPSTLSPLSQKNLVGLGMQSSGGEGGSRVAAGCCTIWCTRGWLSILHQRHHRPSCSQTTGPKRSPEVGPREGRLGVGALGHPHRAAVVAERPRQRRRGGQTGSTCQNDCQRKTVHPCELHSKNLKADLVLPRGLKSLDGSR